MSNLAYSINGDEVIFRTLNDGELKKAREEALPKLNEGKWALRSCWNCNLDHILNSLRIPKTGFSFDVSIAEKFITMVWT